MNCSNFFYLYASYTTLLMSEFEGNKEVHFHEETIALLEEKIKQLENKIAELQKNEPEEYLQKAFERARDLIVIIQDGKVKYANPVLDKFSGYSLEMIKDKPFAKFLSGPVQKKLIERYEARMAGKKLPEKYETTIHNKEGKEIHVEISGHMITYRGKPADFVILHDITQLKSLIRKLEESEAKYRNFFKASKDCVFFTTPTGKWLDMSDSAPAFFGFDSKEELMATPIPELYENPEERKQDLEKIDREGFTRDVPINLKRKDGRVINTLVTSQAIRDQQGNIVAYQGIIHDITDLKKKESQLKESKKHLEETLAARDKFFSIISHDLRTPFNAIIGLSDFLRKEAAKMQPEEIESIAEDLYRTGQETYELLTNLLDWSRTVTGKIPLKHESFSLDQLVEDVRKLFQENLTRKELQFRSNIPAGLLVYADRNMVHTILRNLISNAIKFSQPGNAIRIKAVEKNDYVNIQVIDQGIGIPEESCKKLFDRESSKIMRGTLGEGGSGLGLILCKEFTERNDGEISVTSKVGEGTTFTFTLPLPKGQTI